MSDIPERDTEFLTDGIGMIVCSDGNFYGSVVAYSLFLAPVSCQNPLQKESLKVVLKEQILDSSR